MSDELYQQIYGAGQPLVLLHGFTGSSQNWLDIVPQLSGYQCILPDIIGHGRSPSPTDIDAYRMENVATQLLATLPEKFYLLGYSMGGRLALYLATQYPERILGLILESTSPGLTTSAERQQRQQNDEALAKRIEQDGISAFVDYWEQLPLWRSQNQLTAVIKERLHQQRLQNRPDGLANSLRGMGTGVQPDLWPALPQIQLPTLQIIGELDDKFVKINQAMHTHLPHSTLEIVKQAGHTVHLEQPDTYVELVMSFLHQH